MTDWPETSESLILRVKDPQDEASWRELVAVYRPVVFRMARSRGLQHEDAEDLAQGVFVSVARAIDQWQGTPYLVMQYTRGVSLQKRLHQQGPLKLREILRVGLHAARGLAAAHAQGLVHRDVKPSNILLDSTVERSMLADFGLARAVDDASLTRSGTLAGTPQYMSPEQARAEAVDHRSDLFSLGSVLYAMCTGHAPFRAESSYGALRLITAVHRSSNISSPQHSPSP
jgi:serine/threonine protein kinase